MAVTKEQPPKPSDIWDDWELMFRGFQQLATSLPHNMATRVFATNVLAQLKCTSKLVNKEKK